MKVNISAILIITLFTGCVKEYPLKSSGQLEVMPVIFSFLQPDSEVSAYYSRAVDITQNIGGINSAVFTVYRNQNLLGNMISDGDGNYHLAAGTFLPRDSFRIVAVENNNHTEIRGAFPSKMQFLTVDTETVLVAGVGPAFNVIFSFPDSAIDDNFYRLFIRHQYFQYKTGTNGNITDSILMNSTIPLFGSELPFIQNNFNNYTSREILFRDATFNGTNPMFRVYTTTDLYNKKSIRTLKIEIILENISETLYNYYNTRNAHLWQQQSISQLPGTVEGNIPGGFGVVGAYTFTRRVIGF